MTHDAEKILAEARETVERLADLQPPDPLAEDAITRWERQMPRPEPRPAKQRTAATQEPDWTGWEAWLRARLDAERAFVLECVGAALGQALQKERAVAKRELASEVRSLRLELTEASEVIAELRKAIAAGKRSGEIIDLQPVARRN